MEKVFRLRFKLKRKEIEKIPATSGVYGFYESDRVLYIGKSVNLRARIKSHFRNKDFDSKERAIVDRATDIRIIPTESDFKALILEARLIKDYKPRFNKIWRDDKSYLYIKITVGEKYPIVYPVRKEEDGKSIYFGPFSSLRVINRLLREIRKIIPFCGRRRLIKKPCFYSKIGLCHPCPGEIEALSDKKKRLRQQKLYRNQIDQIIRIFKGDLELIIDSMFKKLRRLIRENKFEEALVLRDQIYRLERLLTHRFINDEYGIDSFTVDKSLRQLSRFLNKFFPELNVLKRIECYDISNLSGRESAGSMVVFSGGVMDKSQYRRFKIKAAKGRSDAFMLAQVIERRFKNNWPKPDLIIVDGGRNQVSLVKKKLGQLGIGIPVVGIVKAPDRLVIGIAGLPIVRLGYDHSGMNLVRFIRDESHRFAKKYHLILRRKKLLLY